MYEQQCSFEEQDNNSERNNTFDEKCQTSYQSDVDIDFFEVMYNKSMHMIRDGSHSPFYNSVRAGWDTVKRKWQHTILQVFGLCHLSLFMY